MSIYRFLNVYEALRIDGIQNAFHEPEIVYSEGIQSYKVKQKDSVIPDRTATNRLKEELIKQGNGFIKYIIQYKHDFIIGVQRDIPPKTKDVIKKEDTLKKEANALVDEQKKVRDQVGKDAFDKLQQGYPYNRIVKEIRLEFENKKLEFINEINSLKNELLKYKTGEKVSELAVPSYKKAFGLLDKGEHNEKIGRVVAKNEQSEYFQQLEIDRREKKIAQLKKQQQQKERKEIELVNKNNKLFLELTQHLRKNNHQKYGCIYFNNNGLLTSKYSNDLNDIKSFLSASISDAALRSIREELLNDINNLSLKNKEGVFIPVIIKRYYLKKETIYNI